jgi:hypothetical protein
MEQVTHGNTPFRKRSEQGAGNEHGSALRLAHNAGLDTMGVKAMVLVRAVYSVGEVASLLEARAAPTPVLPQVTLTFLIL